VALKYAEKGFWASLVSGSVLMSAAAADPVENVVANDLAGRFFVGRVDIGHAWGYYTCSCLGDRL